MELAAGNLWQDHARQPGHHLQRSRGAGGKGTELAVLEDLTNGGLEHSDSGSLIVLMIKTG